MWASPAHALHPGPAAAGVAAMSLPAAPAEPAGAGGAAAPAAAAVAEPPPPLVSSEGDTDSASDSDGANENEVPELISGSDYESDDALWPAHPWPAGGLNAQLAWPGPGGPGPAWHLAPDGGDVANVNAMQLFLNNVGGNFGGGNMVRGSSLRLRRCRGRSGAQASHAARAQFADFLVMLPRRSRRGAGGAGG